MQRQRDAKGGVLTIAMVVLLTAGFGNAAAAQGPGHRSGDRPGRGFGDRSEMRVERMTRHLDLSEEQVAAVTAIQAKGQAANLELRKEMLRLQNEKRGEMLKDDPSEKKVLDLTRRIGDLRTAMQANRMRDRLEVRKLLTPAQRDKMLMLGEHRGDRRGGHGDRRGEECRGRCGAPGEGGCGNR